MPPVPIYVKGGVWSNIEDQILKAAIQKYGTHQWSKVASLLQKKTAKQCESRWNEFLNPNLNFSEFSKEDDSRLLELVKKLPNQWRTISEAMGRTAQACINRYNTLLEGEDSELKLGSSLDFEVGNIDLAAESRPARPDPADLDSMDKEMLAEARARLLNTQGKKATRKIRERMLEESKRVAHLQKRRELKQAGIDSKIKAPRKKYGTEIDYNADVVYEREPLSGPYDTSEEDKRAARAITNFERSVDRSGLKDDARPGKSARPNKKRGRDEKTQISGDDSIVTNEYKKPKLELPIPALASQGKAVGAGTEHRTKPSKKAILRLFQQLPEPKNDFEIVLDDESEDEETEQTNSPDIESENLSREVYEEMSASLESRLPEQQVSTDSPNYKKFQSSRAALPLPDPIISANTPIDIEFNALLASTLIGHEPIEGYEPIEGQETLIRTKNALFEALEEPQEQERAEYEQRVRRILSKSPYDNPDATQTSIEDALSRLKTLQTSMAEANLLKDQNTSTANKIFTKLLPKLSHLRQKYYLHYKMYQNEYYAIQARKKKLELFLEGAKRS
ncbi:Cef1p [Lachancea thermotolerans CBS 6340]|uniref:Pre-mRNA-splicing factor CEF1 n=1 Tax=Lachancea thermotolerans (strain ATCC 56472 / CBS 6340 / NRRL Y-8284) TaxID=559295 RepID=C5DF59_LACTC|nr:KLTH0D12452p [Lachancea thermotolerans CBS 6340]CAR22814.1 KLTH0D12452p [Lachancea thermotolerans CBS 6340]